MEAIEKSLTENVAPTNVKVLCIGDGDDILTPKNSKCKNFKKILNDNLRSHMAYLIMGTRQPAVEVSDISDLFMSLYVMDRITLSSIKVPHQPRRFKIQTTVEFIDPPGFIMSTRVLNAREVMDAVRQRLRTEHWITPNEFESSNATIDFIYQVVSEAMENSEKRLFRYVLQQHQVYRSKKRNN